MYDKCNFDNLEVFASTIAAACHDLGHPGYSNQFLIENKDPIAIKYNGKISGDIPIDI